MPEYNCNECNKKFDNQESFNQHNLAKHTIAEKPKRHGSGASKKYGMLISVIVIIAIAGAYFGLSKSIGYVILTSDSDHTKGTGQIEVIEYSDFQCPACGAAEPYVREIVSKYGDKIRFTYKQFPLTSIHPYAFKAAEASECSADQAKFWEYHDKLFDNQQKLDVGSLKKYAEQVGLDTKLFNACLDSGAMSSRVSSDINEARSKGVGSTPTFFVDGKKNVGVMTIEKFLELSGL